MGLKRQKGETEREKKRVTETNTNKKSDEGSIVESVQYV